MGRGLSNLPAEFRYRPFLVRDALAAGVPEARLSATDLYAPVAGVRVARSFAHSGKTRVLSVGLVLGRHQRVSGTSALLLLGAPLPEELQRAEALVNVVSWGGVAPLRRRGVIGRVTSDVGSMTVDGVQCSTPSLAWFEARRTLTHDDLVIAGDYLVREGGPATCDDLRAAIRPGAVQSALARRALASVRAGAESPMETKLRLLLVRAGIPEPELNIDVLDRRGAFLGRVDMLWPASRVGLEYDGSYHYLSRAAWERDRKRSNEFVAEGWRVLHVSAQDARSPADVIQRLRELLASAP
ncbi:endonuclease domain-containing protein [Curtobacterium ammoniigenes]|uniref:endonuclease domain-containing protein n=1 Tax=Curtobacterium ammoniigenes TaxID=395387 RepID=UPI0008339FD7|nr:hypothetical protein [Curtobacterium ammoniigenes]